eukprot:5336983-Prymnesium_polylepis.1
MWAAPLTPIALGRGDAPDTEGGEAAAEPRHGALDGSVARGALDDRLRLQPVVERHRERRPQRRPASGSARIRRAGGRLAVLQPIEAFLSGRGGLRGGRALRILKEARLARRDLAARGAWRRARRRRRRRGRWAPRLHGG